MIQTDFYVDQKVRVWMAVCAGALRLSSYSLADYINHRSDPPIISVGVVDHYHRASGHDGLEPYRNKDGSLNYAGIAIAFLGANAKYYGCLPDLGQVDDVLFPPTGSGVRMYVSAAGSDANNGLTSATPKQTLAAVLFALNSSTVAQQTPPTGAVYPAGSRIYLRRGDTFTGTFQMKNGTGNSDYLIGAYGTPTLARPKILYSNLNVAGGVGFGACISIAGNGSPTGPFVVQNIDIDVQNASTIVYTGLTGGTPAVSDTVTCSRTGNTATISQIPAVGQANTIECRGFLIPAGTNGVAGIQAGDTIGNGTWSATVSSVAYTHGFFCSGFISNITMRNFSVSNASANGISPTGGSGVTPANYLFTNGLIQNCQTVYNKGAGIGGGVGTNITYNHLTALTNGRDGVFSHGIYVVGTFSPSFVTNNYIYGSSNNGMTLHGGGSGVTISDNFLEGNGNGFGFGPGFGTTGEVVDSSTVVRNIILNSGTIAPFSGGGGYGQGMGVSNWTNSSFINNQFVGNALTSVSFTGTLNGTDAQNTNLTFYNNTLDTPSGATGLSILHNTSAAPQVSLDIRNNIFSSASTTQFMIVKSATETIPLASVTLNANLYYMPNKASSASVGQIIQWDGTNYTLAGFNAFDSTKEVTQFYANPQFISPIATASGPNPNGRKFNGIYRQAVAGKLTGASLGVTTDFNKTPRTVQNVGAFV